MICVFTSSVNNRVRYALKLLFDRLLHVPHHITSDPGEYAAFDGPKVYYDRKPGPEGLFIPMADLLNETGIREQKIHISRHNSCPVFFASGQVATEIPFDIFAASFYLVSRYEEYLPHLRDQHDRFEAVNSLAYKENFLSLPLVNIWAGWLKEAIEKRYDNFRFPKLQYKFVSSIDIDNAYAILEKGAFRTVGALGRDLFKQGPAACIKRLKVLTGKSPDPYDTYAFQREIQEQYKIEYIYFFLLGDYGVNDKNVPASSRRLQLLMKSLADNAAVGIHPSYASNDDPGLLKKELSRISSILKRDIVNSRQHFLRLRLPDTYRALLELDIQNDYTMGYASEPGFRASICTPFYFYDLDLETESKLLIHPFAVMEATLKYYKKVQPEDALRWISPLIDSARSVNGVFMSLWHNESLSEDNTWKGWKKVYTDMVEYAVKKSANDPVLPS